MRPSLVRITFKIIQDDHLSSVSKELGSAHSFAALGSGGLDKRAVTRIGHVYEYINVTYNLTGLTINSGYG